MCNFADDNNLFCNDKNLDLAFFNLSSDLWNVMDWFKIISLKANPGKSQFMVLGAKKNDCFNLWLVKLFLHPVKRSYLELQLIMN